MSDRKPYLIARVVEAKGKCGAGHAKGDVIELDCTMPGGMCGYLYHQIFPSLQTLEGGGKMPWWEGEGFTAVCPDPENTITLSVARRPREA